MCLKFLQHEPTGGIVAAPTFGLPEWPGADRNWDYRYVWLRDAAFVIFAFLRIGFVDEATRSPTGWPAGASTSTAATGCTRCTAWTARHRMTQTELDHFAGYAGSRPVRIGNNAYPPGAARRPR